MSQTEEPDDVKVCLPLFNENDVQILKLIGSGSYGVVNQLGESSLSRKTADHERFLKESLYQVCRTLGIKLLTNVSKTYT